MSSAIWNTLRNRDSRGLSALIASGSVDVNEVGAVRLSFFFAPLRKHAPRRAAC